MGIFSDITERELLIFILLIVGLNCLMGLIKMWLDMNFCIKAPKWPAVPGSMDKEEGSHDRT